MKQSFKIMKSSLLALALVLASSCEIFDLDINTNPNAISTGDPDLLMTSVIYNANAVFADGLNNATHGFLGITSSTDNFDMTNATWNGTWNFLYAGPLKDLEALIEVASRDVAPADGKPDLPHHLGIARTLKAFYFGIMVDTWGDIPYSEAFKGDAPVAITAPKYDDDAAIYADLITLCDSAVANLARVSPVPVKGDPIFGAPNTTATQPTAANIVAWRRTAKSVKLKLLVNTMRVQDNTAAINALIAGNDLVDAGADFTFRFGKFANPDYSHPWYSSAYSQGQNQFSYFGHQFMVEMLRDLDPRIKFYLKRQTTTVLDPSDATARQTIPCSQRDDCVYSYLVLNPNISTLLNGNVPPQSVLAGYFGRDRSDPSGVPNDGGFRTSPGVYPAGGLYDDVAEATANNNGFGDGIFPMITGWMVKLYKIEAALANPGITGVVPRTVFESAMREQIGKVNTFGALDPQRVAMTTAEVDAYVSLWLTRYDAATNKLSPVLKQAWFMNFGNGFELYNAFRRTGLPSDIQTPLQRPRQFALRMPYAQDEINLNAANTPVIFYDNPNAAVFWDVLKFQF